MSTSLLAGCENNSDNKMGALNTVKQYEKAAKITGSVESNKRLVKVGEIKATDNKGAIIATTHLKQNGRYSIDIPARTNYPIVLSVYPKTDQSSTEVLKAVVMSPY